MVVVACFVVFRDVAGVVGRGRRRERQGKAGEEEKQTLYTPNSRSPASGGNYWYYITLSYIECNKIELNDSD